MRKRSSHCTQLADKDSGQVSHLRCHEQRCQLQGTAPASIPERLGEQAEVESKPLKSEVRSLSCLAAGGSEIHRTGSVTELLAKKARQSELVVMEDNGIRRPCANEAVIGPAGSEFAVFVCKGKRFVKAADVEENLARHGKVIRREVTVPASSAAEPPFCIIAGDLMSGGVTVVGKSVFFGATQQAFRVASQ